MPFTSAMRSYAARESVNVKATIALTPPYSRRTLFARVQAWLAENPSVVGYVILNSEGIPVKHHEKVQYDKAVQSATALH